MTQNLSRSHILTGRLRPTIWRLALPVLLEQVLVFCVGFFDTYLAGHLSESPADATTAVGIAAYVGWLASLMFGLVGVGTTALVSRHWGAQEHEDANAILNQSVLLASAAGLFVAAGLYISAPFFADWLSLNASTRQIVVDYLQTDALGHLFWSITLVGGAALRGAGDMTSPMIMLGVINVLNMVVSYGLVHGIDVGSADTTTLLDPMGVRGIVLGTLAARVTGGLLMLVVLGRGLSGLHVHIAKLRPDYGVIRRILQIGVPAGIDGGVMWFGHFLFLTVIAKLDHSTGQTFNMAAHTIGIQVEAITYLPAVAWGQATSTLIGQSLGAGEKERAYRAGHEGVLQCGLLAIAISLVFYFGATEIFGLMSESAEVQRIGVPAFRMLAFVQIPLVAAIVYVSSLRGAGDSRYPMLITITSVMTIRVPVAYLGGIVLDGGLVGAWIGMCADVCVRSLLSTIRYARGKWVDTRI